MSIMSEKNYNCFITSANNNNNNKNKQHHCTIIYLLYGINYINRQFGMNIRCKSGLSIGKYHHHHHHHHHHQRQQNQTKNVRLHCFLALLWFDSIYTALIGTIVVPIPENERLLLQLGDIAYSLMPEKRGLFWTIVLMYRISCASMVTMFAQDDFCWLAQANTLFNHLKTSSLYDRLFRLQRRCRLTCAVVICFRTAIILATHILGVVIYYDERDSKYFLIHTYVYMVYYSSVYTSINMQFLIEIYFLCRVCSELFDSINHRFEIKFLQLSSNHHNNPNFNNDPHSHDPNIYILFQKYFHQFSDGCVFVHSVMSYVKPMYIIFFLCNLIVDILILFNGISVNNSSWLNGFFLIYSIEELSFIVFLASVVGKIDIKAKQLSDFVYYQCLIVDLMKRNTTANNYNKSNVCIIIIIKYFINI